MTTIQSDTGIELERKGWNWAPLPAEIILSPKLKPVDKIIYAYLLWRAGQKGMAWPGEEKIAADLSISVGGVRKAFATLTAQDWIRRVRRLGRSSLTYIFERQEDCRTFAPSSTRVDDSRLPGEMTVIYQDRQLNESQLTTVSEPDIPGAENAPEVPEQVIVKLDKQVQAKPAKTAAEAKTYYPLAAALGEVCHMDIKANSGRLFREAKLLSQAKPEPTAEMIRQQFGEGNTFWINTWPGTTGQFPEPHHVREKWGQWLIERTLNVKPTSTAPGIRGDQNSLAARIGEGARAQKRPASKPVDPSDPIHLQHQARRDAAHAAAAIAAKRRAERGGAGSEPPVLG